MAKRPTVTSISSGYASNTQLNANFEALRDGFDNTLSLDGSVPNAMEVDFDLDGNDIINGGTLNASDITVGGTSLATQVSAAATSASNAATSETNAAASAASAAIDAESVLNTLLVYTGTWLTATAYAVNDLATDSGSTYICVVAHTSGTFSTDLGDGKWALFASKGVAGAGAGDLQSVNNLSDVASAATSLFNLGFSATASEINVLDGITASTAELNTLTGITASTAELNTLTGITATVTELNYVDGVTSAVQTQLDTKASSSNPVFTGSIEEQTGTMPAGTTPAIDPENGTVQEWTLTGSSSPTDSLSDGEYITLMIDDGSSYTITWPTITWVNNGGTAPTLATTGYTVIAIWKVGTTLYGALVGDGT